LPIHLHAQTQGLPVSLLLENPSLQTGFGARPGAGLTRGSAFTPALGIEFRALVLECRAVAGPLLLLQEPQALGLTQVARRDRRPRLALIPFERQPTLGPPLTLRGGGAGPFPGPLGPGWNRAQAG